MGHRVCDLRRGTLEGLGPSHRNSYRWFHLGKVSVWLAKTIGSVLRVHDLDPPPSFWKENRSSRWFHVGFSWSSWSEAEQWSNHDTTASICTSTSSVGNPGASLSRDHRDQLVKLLLGMMVFVEGEAKEPMFILTLTCESKEISL